MLGGRVDGGVCWEHGDNMGFISVEDQDLLSPL